MRGRFSDEAVDDFEAVFFMGFLPPFEPELDADLHIVIQKLDGVIKFGLEVVGINGRTELKFLHPAARGFVGFLGLGFLVEELAVIDDAADGWDGGGVGRGAGFR